MLIQQRHSSVSQSGKQEKIDNFAILWNFYSIVAFEYFVTRYSRYGFSVTRRLVWSTLNGLFGCIFDVGRVNLFCTSRPFLLLSPIG